MNAQILAALVLCGFSTQTLIAQKAAASWKEYLGGTAAQSQRYDNL